MEKKTSGLIDTYLYSHLDKTSLSLRISMCLSWKLIPAILQEPLSDYLQPYIPHSSFWMIRHLKFPQIYTSTCVIPVAPVQKVPLPSLNHPLYPNTPLLPSYSLCQALASWQLSWRPQWRLSLSLVVSQAYTLKNNTIILYPLEFLKNILQIYNFKLKGHYGGRDLSLLENI